MDLVLKLRAFIADAKAHKWKAAAKDGAELLIMALDVWPDRPLMASADGYSGQSTDILLAELENYCDGQGTGLMASAETGSFISLVWPVLLVVLERVLKNL